MNIDGVVVLVEERRLPHKLEMLNGNLELDRAAQPVDFLFSIRDHGLAGVLFKGSLSSSNWCDPDIAGSFNKVQQHLLVIAAQAHHTLRVVLLQLSHEVDAAGGVWATIDQIAKKYYRVSSLIPR